MLTLHSVLKHLRLHNYHFPPPKQCKCDVTAKIKVDSFIYLFNYAVSTGLLKKMDGIWNRYNLKSTGRIYTFGILKYSEKFKVLDLL